MFTRKVNQKPEQTQKTNRVQRNKKKQNKTNQIKSKQRKIHRTTKQTTQPNNQQQHQRTTYARAQTHTVNLFKEGGHTTV